MKYKNYQLTDYIIKWNYMIRQIERGSWSEDTNYIGYYKTHKSTNETYIWVPIISLGIFSDIADIFVKSYPKITFIVNQEEKQAQDLLDQFLLQMENLEIFL